MIYDLIIVGDGPAGLTAGIYAQRYKLSTLLIGKDAGGTAATAHKVCNYPGFENISGPALMEKIENHAKSLGLNIIYENIVKITKDKHFILNTFDKTYEAKKVIFAIGMQRRKLEIKGENQFLGKGVSYCATCDAGFFKNKTVSVIGGSDAALTAALLLADYAEKVYIIYRKPKFERAEPMWVDSVNNNKKIQVIFNEEVEEIKGDNKVSSIKLKHQTLATDGVFIEIGAVPNTEIIKELNITTENNFIIADNHQRTNVKGFFAAGDITNNPLKQIVTAAGEGATAAFVAFQELKHD